ncbi:helix-turn-helix transcriptional regulator [Mycolicibacterium brisbanense]
MYGEQQYEWMFVVPEISGPDDARIDALSDRVDSVVESHSGLNLVTLLAPGDTALAAARSALRTLDQCGLRPARSYPDLVARGDIAERVGVERQAVDHWIRGQRRKGFPGPVHLAARGLWLWHDVAEWLEREHIDRDTDHGIAYPSLSDHALIDNQLRVPYISAVVAVNTTIARFPTCFTVRPRERRRVGVGA